MDNELHELKLQLLSTIEKKKKEDENNESYALCVEWLKSSFESAKVGYFPYLYYEKVWIGYLIFY